MTIALEIKNRIDAVELISETVKLRRSGSSYTGFCPFHDNKSTPAFVVWPDSGTWKCFGACNDGGDVFSFVMKKEGWDFGETLRHLARRAGVELQDITPQQQEKREEHERLYQLMTLAVTFYQDRLRSSSAAQAARDHLVQRGLSEEVCENFGLGYAPDSWNAGLNFFREEGYSAEQMVGAGLVVQKNNGRSFDRFRNRVMIPIRDQRGRTVGFGARIVDPDDSPKFMNSPQGELFDKGALLYGIDHAYLGIRENQAAILVEGYMDVIAAHQAGFTNVVSAMGTALTEKQLRLLKTYTRRLVLALDSDVAGDRATLRSLTVARETLERETAPAFDPRGLLRDEGPLNLDIRVVTLPSDTDPDELIAQDPEAWRALTEGAKTIVDYVIDVFTSDRDLRDSKIKAEIIDDVLPIISDVSHPAERTDYQQKLARLLQIDERVLMGLGKMPARGRSPRKKSVASRHEHESDRSSAGLAHDELETYCLAALVYKPVLLSLVDRSLREAGSSVLSHQDFAQSGFQLIFRQLRLALHQDEADPSDYLRDSLDHSLHDQLLALLSAGQVIDLQDERRLYDVLQAAARLRGRNIGVWLTELRFLEQTAREQGDIHGAAIYQDQTVTHTLALKGIQRYLARQSRRESISDGLIS